MKKSLHALYSGSVQGVGFRYAARSAAKKLLLTGWVKNLPDGRVELLMEGEETSLKLALEEIRSRLNYSKFTAQVTWGRAMGGFSSFEIRA